MWRFSVKAKQERISMLLWKKNNFIFSIIFVVLFSGRTYANDIDLNVKLALLINAYPSTLSHYKDNMLYFKNGLPSIQIDDGLLKSHSDKLRDSDIEDSLLQIYPAGSCKSKHKLNFDPGRMRSDKLMRSLYGSSKSSVRKDLIAVNWFGQKVMISKRHGAANALLAVRNAIKSSPKLHKYVKKIGGAFNWRNIAGTSRLSAHSFGIAIDLNTSYAHYWKWTKSSKSGNIEPINNKYPLELVSIFENHGYIWGGRWYHYDTMHFEYRPELIAISRLSDIGNACNNLQQ